jgi:hypothetical protein
MPTKRTGGGTSMPEQGSKLPALLVFLVLSPVVAYLVHMPYSSCGWTWSGVGGVCRAILLISILTGLVAGGLAAACARAFLSDERRRAALRGALVVVAVVLGMLAAKQFGDYARGFDRTAAPRPLAE